jgi:hypothetical protein
MMQNILHLDDHSSTSRGVDDQTLTTPSQSKIDRSPMMDRVFVELMLEQAYKRKTISRTFTRQASGDMAESLNIILRCRYGKVVLKKCFSWDKRQHKVVADDQVWQKMH